jgi:hypothetical protein
MAVPISAPIPAVTAIARAPQKSTLSAGFPIGAPPAQGAERGQKDQRGGGRL